MELGVSLPTSGPLATPANIARVAQEAERLGYASVWTYERLLRPIAPVPQAGGPPQPVPAYYRLVYDPLETLAYVAALTDRVKLGTSVVDALFHPPVVLARRYATLDQLSGGRVIVGVGQGWMPQEFATAAVPMKRRGAGMDDHIAAMRAVWGPDPVRYEGRFYEIAESEINPKPVQEHLPVLLGSVTPAGVQRAARIADGLNPIAFSADSLRGLVTAFRDAVRENGRDPAGQLVVVRANVPITADPLGDDRPFLGGSPRQVAEDLATVEDLELDQVLFANTAAGDIEESVRLFASLRETVPA
jgi:probable F420-dependent oxidoreductase